MKRSLIVSIHDVAPSTFDASRTWLDLIESHGMCAVLLVVPGPWQGQIFEPDSPFSSWLTAAIARGHEVALHGWEHKAVPPTAGSTRPLRRLRAIIRARGCAEFAVLDTTEARRRVELGLATLAGAGIEPVGFVPPGWLALRSTDRVLRAVGLRYTTTQWTVRDVANGTTHRVPSTSQRPGSPLTHAAARANRAFTAVLMRMRRSFRIALHPHDLDHEVLWHDTDRSLLVARRNGYRSVTYAQLVGADTRTVTEVGVR